jgi:hypothetical protein
MGHKPDISMMHRNGLIWIHIDDLRQANHRFGLGKVIAVKMQVAVKMIARFSQAEQPVQGF